MIEVKEYKPKVLKYNIEKNLNDKTHTLQFLPEPLEEISKTTDFSFKGKKLKTSYLIDIIHNLILKYYFKKENYFNLSSIILKEKYGQLYNYYIEFLVLEDIIILSKNHQKGKNSRIYRLTNYVIKSKISRYKNTDKILLRKYKNAVCTIDDDNDIKSINLDVKSKLIDDLFHVEIEFDKAICFLNSTTQDIDIYNRNKYSVDCINDKHIFYHFDGYGRLHTNFTILKSFIRKNCLLIDKEETYEKDLSNSQPLFLCKMLNNSPIVDAMEYQLFKYLSLNGRLYEYIMDKTGITVKKDAKELIYKVLFGKNFNSKADISFISLFPTIHAFIKDYKKINNNYKVLSHHLQKEESELIFNKIIKSLMYIYPEIRIISIHDSIICQKKYRDIVNNIFDKKVKEEFSHL
jgi:hypothetical protein